MQSPAATRYCPRRSCAALGVESGIGWDSSPVGVSGPAGVRGQGRHLTGSPPRSPDRQRRRADRRARSGRGGAWLRPAPAGRGLQVARRDLVGGVIGQRRHGAGRVVAGILREGARAHREYVGHVPDCRYLLTTLSLRVVAHDRAAGVVRGLVGHDAEGADARLSLISRGFMAGPPRPRGRSDSPTSCVRCR
jgi:hypothetical protein